MRERIEIGALVWFTHRQARCVGRVVKLSKRAKFVVIELDGKLLKGPRERFIPCPHCSVTEIGPVWSLTGYRRVREGSGENCEGAFVATILCNGKPVLRMRARGHGEAVVYEPTPTAPVGTKRAFYNFVKAWNCDGICSDEQWVNYMVHGKPKGQTRDEYLLDQQTLMTRLMDIRTYDAQIAARRG